MDNFYVESDKKDRFNGLLKGFVTLMTRDRSR